MAWWKPVAAGMIAGVAATAAMSVFQTAAAKPFGQEGSDEEPANEKAADSASALATGKPVSAPNKKAAGSLVHYATGTALGVGYALAAARAPAVTRGFGVPFGLGVALVLDDLLVPAFGWGEWPTETGAATHAYGLTSHAVFGAALEGGRRAVMATLD